MNRAELSLARLVASDSARVLAWRNQPDVRRWMLTEHEITQSEHDRWLSAALVDDSRLFWIISLDGIGVGVSLLSGLRGQAASCTFGIYIADPIARGTGAAAAAIAELLDIAFASPTLLTVCCEVFADNHAARALYERVGLRLMNPIGKPTRTSRGVVELLSMAIERSEWTAASERVGQYLSTKNLVRRGREA